MRRVSSSQSSPARPFGALATGLRRGRAAVCRRARDARTRCAARRRRAAARAAPRSRARARCRAKRTPSGARAQPRTASASAAAANEQRRSASSSAAMSPGRSRSGAMRSGNTLKPVIEIFAEMRRRAPPARGRDCWSRARGRRAAPACWRRAARLRAPAARAAAWLAGSRSISRDLVEQQRAAVRLHELADAARLRARERALLVTEQRSPRASAPGIAAQFTATNGPALRFELA